MLFWTNNKPHIRAKSIDFLMFESLCPNRIFVQSKIRNMKDDVLTNGRTMTVDEYIAFEERSDIRHEFINGNLIPMPGTSLQHNSICINLVMLLRMMLGKDAFRVFQENVKVQVSSEKDYTYPDVVVTNDPRDFRQVYVLQHPCVIFEVISKNSRVEDSVDKFVRYKKIESLQNYVLVDSEKVYVEVRTRSEHGEWVAQTYFQDDANFAIPALGIELALSSVYEGVG
jgi:Uma2 family endonuclease